MKSSSSDATALRDCSKKNMFFMQKKSAPYCSTNNDTRSGEPRGACMFLEFVGLESVPDQW
jgi:hypothetical protein